MRCQQPILCLVIVIALVFMYAHSGHCGGSAGSCAKSTGVIVVPTPQVTHTVPACNISGGTPLDLVLMKHKEQGVWYFPCAAPINLYRIPPHYLSFAPPPPPCGPVPVAPMLPYPGQRK